MENLLTPEAVSKWLSIPVVAVLRSSIPRIKIGHRTIRYKPEDVQAYLELRSSD